MSSKLSYFIKNISSAFGLILLWHGSWVVLDWLSKTFFSENPLILAIIGIIVGFLILYLPDKNLKSLENL